MSTATGISFPAICRGFSIVERIWWDQRHATCLHCAALVVWSAREHYCAHQSCLVCLRCAHFRIPRPISPGVFNISISREKSPPYTRHGGAAAYAITEQVCLRELLSNRLRSWKLPDEGADRGGTKGS